MNFLDADGKERNRTVKNGLAAISEFLSTVPRGAVLCAENTGTYGDLLVFTCNQCHVPIALVPGYTVRHSFGPVKGKSDPLDAARIREYGERFHDRLSFKQYQSENMAELRQLSALRSQLVKVRKGLVSGEHARTRMPMQSIAANLFLKTALDAVEEQIRKTENEMAGIIQSDAGMQENYTLAVSVKGVGPVIATDMLIRTGNFNEIDTARKAASYAGVCPFPNASGKMTAKASTSPFADKKLKSMLFLGARVAVRHDKEYRLYYERKKLEGKPHYLIMTNLSNKLLRTLYSVVKNRTPYAQDHVCLDPRERNMPRQ